MEKNKLEPLVLAIVKDPLPEGRDIELELNLRGLQNIVDFDWGQVKARRVVVIGGNSKWHEEEAERCRRACVAARASSVGIVPRLQGLPDGFDAGPRPAVSLLFSPEEAAALRDPALAEWRDALAR